MEEGLSDSGHLPNAETLAQANEGTNKLFQEVVERLYLNLLLSQRRHGLVIEPCDTLIDMCNEAKQSANRSEEVRMNKLIKKKLEQDRISWFHDNIAEGKWSAIAQLRKKPKRKQSTLQDKSSQLVYSDVKLETMAAWLHISKLFNGDIAQTQLRASSHHYSRNWV